MNAWTRPLFEGFMVYWSANDNAATYRIHLLIIHDGNGNDLEIAIVEKDRFTKYHSFLGLGSIERDSYGYTGCHYGIFVEAEDRNGNIIDKTIIINVNIQSVVPVVRSQESDIYHEMEKR